jgi:uncharacterized alkaline shock family protein YloU
MSFVRALTFALAAAFTAALGILAILAGVRTLGDVAWAWLLQDGAGVALLIFIGAASLLVSAHFARLVLEERTRSLELLRDGEWGTISLAPGALRQFIGDLLRREIGLARFRVRLRSGEGGLVIEIDTSLASTATITEVGERMQRIVAERVSRQVGVTVERVAVSIRSMRGAAGEGSEGPSNGDRAVL